MADASTYLERSNRDLHISMVYLSLHRREGWSQQSSLMQHGVYQCAENRADFDRVKKVFFTLPLRNFNQSML